MSSKFESREDPGMILFLFFTTACLHGSYTQGKSGNFKKSGKIRESQGEIGGSGKVREIYILKSQKSQRVRESQGI